MSFALLVDFGSTFTKLTVLNMDRPAEAFVARAAVPTTIDDISIGLRRGLAKLACQGVAESELSLKLACSSAAGGLRMVAIGLVPELTAEAAKRAALGAGARVAGLFAGMLTPAEVEAIAQMRPDMLLLAGGTDGGNSRALLHNAAQLAAGPAQLGHVPVVIAGNKDAAPRAQDVLHAAGMDVRVAANVMPELGVIEVEPARQVIRTLFMERIVQAKGLDAAEEYVEGVLMPTPAAVLAAARLLSEGTETQPGFGDLLLVDVGGATTDVHSVGAGSPTEPHVTVKGLPEPVVKRTVEGDLGVGVSVASLVEVVGLQAVTDLVVDSAGGEAHKATGADDDVGDVVEAETVADVLARLKAAPATLPGNAAEIAVDLALARLAAGEAAARHVGRMEERFTSVGMRKFLTGKDLRNTRYIIGTGGVIVHSVAPRYILEACLFSTETPDVLLPRQPQTLVDAQYILSACGLLAQREPDKALAIMKRNLKAAA